ncbi:MAG: hypothetical protein LBL32_03260 [Holosporales bacterium]|nr:hypothetical protein [Holosporales bacterium]
MLYYIVPFFIAFIYGVKAEIQTSAENISIDIKNKMVTLSGMAKVKQDKNTTFSAQTITVLWQDQKCMKLKSIKGVGAVRFEHEEISVTSDACECDMQEVRFTGNVVIISKDLGEIRAGVAVYGMKSKKINIFPNGKRVTLKMAEFGFKDRKKRN